MITPVEIREQCLKWWKDVLISHLKGELCFPKEITRIGRVTGKDILTKLSSHKEEINALYAYAKGDRKRGYSLITTEQVFDKIGTQTIPLRIVIESIDDYLSIIGKEKDFTRFRENHKLILSELPALIDWCLLNPLKLIEHATWVDTLKVCSYFLKNPRSGLYVRQLPIDVHTKYIEENKPLLKSLLSHLIPPSDDAIGETFELMLHLKEKEKRIRIRFLDQSLSPLKGFTDLSFLVYELDQLNVACDYVLVAENEMNFLTLPTLSNTIAIWSGGGFQVSYLKSISWLKPKTFFYWGDIDAHGFQILNQFRTYFENTISVMMDEETLQRFGTSQGQPAPNQGLQRLSETERELYKRVRQDNLRLEQEKIDQAYSEEKIRQAFLLNH